MIKEIRYIVSVILSAIFVSCMSALSDHVKVNPRNMNILFGCVVYMGVLIINLIGICMSERHSAQQLESRMNDMLFKDLEESHR